MIVSHAKNVTGDRFDNDEVKGVLKKVLIAKDEGWKDYVMRLFELDEGGHSPKHTHDWPHIIFVVKGKGSIHLDGKDYEVKEGSYAYIPDDKVHQLQNTGKDKFSFICIVPPEGN